MLISVFDLWILIDRCNLCVQTVHCGGTSRYNTCKNHSNTGSPCAITFKRKPTTMSWSRYCFKKHHISYVLQINTNIKFTIKYTPFSTQNVLIHVTWWERVQLDTLRKQMETNITTRNCCPSWTSRLSIMNIAAVHHEHCDFNDDNTNQLPQSDVCIHQDFPRITIGVHDGHAEMV